VVGAIALTLSTDFVAAMLPGAWSPFLHLQWP